MNMSNSHSDESNDSRYSDHSDSDDESYFDQNINSKYIVEKDMSDFFCFENRNAINVLHVIIRSINKNFIKLETLLSNICSSLTVVAVSETWPTESTKDVFVLPG